ncbi:hypothetical protein D3C83_258120 [compost metagenome]
MLTTAPSRMVRIAQVTSGASKPASLKTPYCPLATIETGGLSSMNQVTRSM